MSATIDNSQQLSSKTKIRTSLRGMLTPDMRDVRADFMGLSESDFKKEIVRRYRAEIVRFGLILIRLRMYREARKSLAVIESKLKGIAGPLEVDLDSFEKAKKDLVGLFIPHNIIRLKPNTSLPQLDTLFKSIYFSADVSSGERRQLQKLVKKEFYEAIFLVDRCMALRFPKSQRVTFDWFLDKKVLKYKNLLRQLRQSHSKFDIKKLDIESFKRSYRGNTEYLRAKYKS